MKSIVFLIFVLFSVSSWSCDTLSNRVALTDGHKVEVDVHGYSVVRLLAREIGPNEIFSARVSDSFAGFECEVVDVVNLSQGCWEVRVEWSPGADFSGCDVEVSSTSGKSYQAFLFMDYHAHY